MKSERKVIPIRVERMSSLTAAERATVLDVCGRMKEMPGALIPILHGVQDELRYVPKDAVPIIADQLNLSRAEVHGVLSFYHWFRQEKPGRKVVHLCRAEACQALGAVELEAHAKRALGIDFHGRTADGVLTLEPVYCLGNCALGPSLMIDHKLCGRVTPARFDVLMAQARAEPRAEA